MRRLVNVVLILLFTLSTLLFSAPGVQAAKSKPPDNATRIAEIAKPGVVFIETIIEADVSAPHALYDENFQFYPDPNGGTINFHSQTGVEGSGFIVTPDGYIVTNAHVVKFTDQYKKLMILKTVASKEAEDKVKKGEISSAEVPYFERGLFMYLLRNAQVYNVSESVYSLLGKSVPGVAVLQKGKQCEIKKAGDPSGTGTGKDVAILKMESSVELPTVKLGDSSKVSTGEKVYCVGYPGVATYHPYLKGMSATIPTVTAGIISAIKKMPGGWSVLQTDAALTHGNSGGPAFNEKGEVVGIATFVSIDYNTGEAVQGFNFLVPVNLAIEFLKEVGVTPHQGQLDKIYQKALNYYWNGQYSKALKEFTIVNQLYPAHPYANQYILKCRQEIEAGHDKKEVPMFLYVIIALLVVLAVAAYFVFKSPLSLSLKKATAADSGSAPDAESVASAGETVIMGVPKTPHAYLIEEDSGKTHKVGKDTTIGRAPTNDVVLSSPAVSKEHARIKYEDEKFVLYDLASTNGTFVNGSKIIKRTLRDGDEVMFGDIKMRFKVA